MTDYSSNWRLHLSDFSLTAQPVSQGSFSPKLCTVARSGAGSLWRVSSTRWTSSGMTISVLWKHGQEADILRLVVWSIWTMQTRVQWEEKID